VKNSKRDIISGGRGVNISVTPHFPESPDSPSQNLLFAKETELRQKTIHPNQDITDKSNFVLKRIRGCQDRDMNCRDITASLDRQLRSLQGNCGECLHNMGCFSNPKKPDHQEQKSRSSIQTSKPSGFLKSQQSFHSRESKSDRYNEMSQDAARFLKSSPSFHSMDSKSDSKSSQSFNSRHSKSDRYNEMSQVAGVSRGLEATQSVHRPPKDERPHRFSVYRAPNKNWTEKEDLMLESAVVTVCDQMGLRPFWVDRRSMKDGQLTDVQDGVFWIYVANLVPGKTVSECFYRYVAIQGSVVARFTVDPRLGRLGATSESRFTRVKSCPSSQVQESQHRRGLAFAKSF
jgi:hypothetical protein